MLDEHDVGHSAGLDISCNIMQAKNNCMLVSPQDQGQARLLQNTHSIKVFLWIELVFILLIVMVSCVALRKG